MTLYDPRSIVKLRRQTPDTTNMLQTFGECVRILYQERMQVVEKPTTTERAMIGALGDGIYYGQIPDDHRLQTTSEMLLSANARNLRILDATVKTQNYDKDIDHFVRKSDPELGRSATVAICSGYYGEYGWAVFLKQKKRRCLLLDTTYGIRLKRRCGLRYVHGITSSLEGRNRGRTQAHCISRTSSHTFSTSIEAISKTSNSTQTSRASLRAPSCTCVLSREPWRTPRINPSFIRGPPRTPSHPIFALPKTRPSPAYDQSKMAATFGKLSLRQVGVARRQSQVAPRLGRARQCSNLPVRGPTRRESRGS
jgi:hypothetical protein